MYAMLYRNWQMSSDCGTWFVHRWLHAIRATRDNSRRIVVGWTNISEIEKCRSSTTPDRVTGHSFPATD